MVELLRLYYACTTTLSISYFFPLLCLPLHLFHMILATFIPESSPHRHVWMWQHCLPCWKLTQLQSFHFGEWRMRAMRRGRSGWQEEPFNRCVFRVALSQPLSRAIDEGGSLWLRQGLKAPVREAWEPSSHQTLLHIKQAGRAALRSPTVNKVERSFDRDTVCRRGGDNKMLQWKNTSLHYIILLNSKPLGFLQLYITHTNTVVYDTGAHLEVVVTTRGCCKQLIGNSVYIILKKWNEMTCIAFMTFTERKWI